MAMPIVKGKNFHVFNSAPHHEQAFLTSAQHGCEWGASYPGHITLTERHHKTTEQGHESAPV
jgi:hypothetical protein